MAKRFVFTVGLLAAATTSTVASNAVGPAPVLYVDLAREASLPVPFTGRDIFVPYVPASIANVSVGASRNQHDALAATPHFQIRNAKLARTILTPDARMVQLVYEPGYAFAHEAVTYFPNTDSLYFCSDAGGRLGRSNASTNNVEFQIRNITDVAARAASGQPTSFAQDVEEVKIDSDSVQMINGGMPYGSDHVLLATSGRGDTLPGGLALVPRANSTNPTILLNNAYGRQFNSPNDVGVHPISGQIFFTDALYGAVQGFRPNLSMPLMTWAYDPLSGNLKALDDTVTVPNGLVISPDGKTVYITDTSPVGFPPNPKASNRASIIAFDVTSESVPGSSTEHITAHSLVNRRLFAWPETGFCDGITVDTNGNVYCGTQDGIEVWSPQGLSIMKMFLPNDGAVDLAFAGHGRIAVSAQERIWLIEGLAVGGPDFTALPPKGKKFESA
ncbi:calcium-dependent phosphotriesterase [Tilletiaria anomala UBC 951]|uniref:Calcium-dependent phosphotriesterase n=1 Tax=Tilletiaria anomala (strain ATCC 24038 / CBS 436.72 / UBC 951) TaxID=1037660 RepID=A0A066VN02_TILAU|nr:calcium-dependent phosphotriesterase [Tilletiaria anomala UBC 951]KDN39940.1 calcium-dependent phosphotriesterase [Tilletiaria anomala UBC 951]